jgi:hypothetical protein
MPRSFIYPFTIHGLPPLSPETVLARCARNNTITGRPCWYGRNSLFSAEIPPMRLARDMPPDWQISQRVSSSSLHHWPSPVGERCRVLQVAPQNLLLLVCPHTEWMCEHGSNGIQVLLPTECAYCTRYDVNRASVHVQRTRTSVGKPYLLYHHIQYLSGLGKLIHDGSVVRNTQAYP